MAITPVPSTRISDAYIRQRLLGQSQSDQRALFTLQNAISTGRRFAAPSEDAPAAQRAISLQRLIEQKTQATSNLKTNQSFLSATDTALASVANLLSDVRASVLSVQGATSSDEQRAAAAQQVTQAIQQLVDVGNQTFRGRYLFAGSQTTVRPFELTQTGVNYYGDSNQIYSYSDVDLLFATNVPGDQAFGAITAAVRGQVDLNPVLTYDTPLADLNGGLGVRKGSISISDGHSTRVIDVSRAATIGDVARQIELNPPAGRTVTARVTDQGLTIQLDSVGSGNLTINEVGGGTTAAQLGILNTTGVGVSVLTGVDLNPRLKATTPLADLLGARARAYLPQTGSFNDLIIESVANGVDLNGVKVNIIDSSLLQSGPGVDVGAEQVVYAEKPTSAKAALRLSGPANDLIFTASQKGTSFNGVVIDLVDGGDIGDAANVSYDPATKRLTLAVDDSGETSIDVLIAAVAADGTFTAARDTSSEINATGGLIVPVDFGAARANTRNTAADAGTLQIYIAPGETTANDLINAVKAEGTFQARLDRSELNNSGLGFIEDSWSSGVTVTLNGGYGENFDKTSGLRITNAGVERQYTFENARTVQDVLNTLNGAGQGLLADFDPTTASINIRSSISGSEFSVAENGGDTATQLGVRSLRGSSLISGFNRGRGINTVAGTDFVIRRSDGVELPIDASGMTTVDDLLNRINNHPANVGESAVVARLATTGNGIEIVNNGPGDQSLVIRRANSSEAAWDLGLIAVGKDATEAPPLGTPATGSVSFEGVNNDLSITALTPGEQYNDVSIRFVDSGQGAGNESVSWDPVAKTLIFDIDQATTTANRVLNTLANDPTTGAIFTGSLVTADGSPNDGSGLVDIFSKGTLQDGAGQTLTGRDRNPAQAPGVFTALIRLRDALLTNDTREIEQATTQLDAGVLQVTYTRADVGFQQQSLDTLQLRLDTEDLELQTALSNEVDVDIIDTISALTARQAALEASLRITAQISQLSLLSFL